MGEIAINDGNENKKNVENTNSLGKSSTGELAESRNNEKIMIIKEALAKLDRILETFKETFATKDWLNGVIADKVGVLQNNNKKIEDRLLNLEKEVNVLKNNDFQQKLKYQYEQEKAELLRKCQEELESKKNDYNKLIEEKDSLLKNSDDKISELATELERVNAEAEGIQKSLNSVKDIADRAVKKKKELEKYIHSNQFKIDGYEKLEEAKEALQKEVDNWKKAKEDLDGKLLEREEDLEHVNSELTESNDKLAEANQQKEKLEEKVGELQEANESMVAKEKELQKITDGWETRMAVYEDVLGTMQQSDVFRLVLKKYGVSGSREEQLFALSLSIGKSLDFALQIYNDVYEYKKDMAEKELLTENEASVYNAVNDCYRKVVGITTNMFVLPGDQPMSVNFKRVPFDSGKMKNFDNPRESKLLYAQGVYVPLLNNIEGTMYKPAQVKAGNL